MKRPFNPIVIQRQDKAEAERAIADLEQRGFEVIFPLTQVSREGKVFDRDSYNRRIFQENVSSSIWKAKLRKVESEGI